MAAPLALAVLVAVGGVAGDALDHSFERKPGDGDAAVARALAAGDVDGAFAIADEKTRPALARLAAALRVHHDAPATAVESAFGSAWAASPRRSLIVAALAGSDAAFRQTLSALAHASAHIDNTWTTPEDLRARLRDALPAGAVDDGPRGCAFTFTAVTHGVTGRSGAIFPEDRASADYDVAWTLTLARADGSVVAVARGRAAASGRSAEDAQRTFEQRSGFDPVRAFVDALLRDAERSAAVVGTPL